MAVTNIAIDCFGAAIILCVLLFFVVTESRSQRSRIFCRLCVFTFLRMVCDAVSYLVDGKQGTAAYILNLAATLLLFVFTYLILAAFTDCIVNFIEAKRNCSRVWQYTVYSLCGAACVLILATQFGGFLYQIGPMDNCYVRGNYFWLLSALTIGILGMDALLLIRCGDVLGRVERRIFVFYIGLYLAALMLLAVNVQPSLLSLFMTAIIVLLAMRIQHKEAESADIDRYLADTETECLGEIYNGIYRWDAQAKGYRVRAVPEIYSYLFKEGILDIELFLETLVPVQHHETLRRFLSAENAETFFARNEKRFQETEYYETPSKSWRQMILSYHADVDPEKRMLLLAFRNNSEEKELQARSEEQMRRFVNACYGVYSNISEWNTETDEGRTLAMTKDGIREDILQGKWSEIIQNFVKRRVLPEDWEAAECMLTERVDKMPTNSSVSCTYRARRSSHEYRWYTSVVRVAAKPDGGRLVTYLTQDIDDSIRERDILKDMSEHDKLTDLFNRTKFESMLKSEYMKLDSCGVLFFDINGLKQINDERGHEAGDAMIRLAAESLRSIASRYVHAYRFGGDEMIAIVCDCSEQELGNLLHMWQNRLEILNRTAELPCSIAVGMSWAGGDFSVEVLITIADERMYENKKAMKKGSDSNQSDPREMMRKS